MPFRELPRLSSTEVGDVLAHATQRIAKHLRRNGLLDEQDDEPESELSALTARPSRRRGRRQATTQGSRDRPWAELLQRAFRIDVLCCPKCRGRMKLIAMVTAEERNESPYSVSPPNR